MNTTSKDRSTGTATRITRAIGAAALSTVLIAGLAGCMTGRVAATTDNVKQNAPVPAGVDSRLPADRIAQKLERTGQTTHGSWTDRIAAQLEHEAGAEPSPSNPYPGKTADYVDRLLNKAQ